MNPTGSRGGLGQWELCTGEVSELLVNACDSPPDSEITWTFQHGGLLESMVGAGI